MADGLLSNILNFIDQRKQATMAGLGLLASNPQEYLTGRTEQLRDFNRAQEAGLIADRSQMRGFPVTQEQQMAQQYANKQLQDIGSGFAGTFIGKGSKLWNQPAEYNFTFLEKQGLSPQEIWKQTGTFRGLDGKLRQEFSDKNATAAYTHLRESGTNRLAEKSIDNPLYEQNYPHLSKTDRLGLREDTPSGSFEWSYSDNPRMGSGFAVSKAPNLNELKSVGIHEMQHAIQALEGFSPGTNLQSVKMYDIPNVYLKKANKLMDKAEKLTELNKLEEAGKLMSERNKILNQGKYAAYARNAGETEARLSQRRMDLTDEERRANFPLDRGLLGIDINKRKINY